MRPFQGPVVARVFGGWLIGCLFGSWLGPTALAGVPEDVARINRSYQIEIKGARDARARGWKNGAEGFLRVLENLEQQYQRSGNLDGVLACREARGQIDPEKPKPEWTFSQPTQDPLSTLIRHVDDQDVRLETQMQNRLAEARIRRTRMLEALQRGLKERGDAAGARTVAEALQQLPEPCPAAFPGRPAPPPEILKTGFLTYDPSTRKWGAPGEEQFKEETMDGMTRVEYVQGNHFLAKHIWQRPLKAGEQFSFRLKGGRSVELVAPDGSDANVHIRLPEGDEAMDLLIIRHEDRVDIRLNGASKTVRYMSNRQDSETARPEVMKQTLFPAVSLLREKPVFFSGATFQAAD